MAGRVLIVCMLGAILAACALPDLRPVPPTPLARTSTPARAAAACCPPIPTATAYATPRPARGKFVDQERGVAITYPVNWEQEPGEQPDTLTWLYPDQRDVFALLFVGSVPAGASLEEQAGLIQQGTANSLNDVQPGESNSATLNDGRAAWFSTFTATRDDGSVVEVLQTSAIRGSQIVTVMAFGEPSAVQRRRDELTTLANSLELRSRLRYGIPEDQALLLLGGESSNPRDYDPAHAEGNSYLYSGLVMLTPELQVAPDLAEGWQVSADGTVYTFRLRQNAHFHNGKPVTAEDVIYSWDRVLDPATDSNYGLTYLGDIVGAAERHAGTASSVRGLRALDPHTLEVTIDAPKPYFLLKLTYGVAYIVDQQNIAMGEHWYRTPNGTGPYRLLRWEEGKLRLYERNPEFYLDPPAIPYVIEQIYAGTGLQLYETGDLDFTGIGGFVLERARDPNGPWPGQLREVVNLCTTYIGFDVTQPPFDDPAVRAAFTLAVDRSQIARIQPETFIPGQGLYPPALPGYSSGLQGQHFDPQAARQRLAESRYDNAASLPPIIFTSGGYGSDIDGVEAALAGMWQTNLGVTVTFENVEPERWDEVMHGGQHGQLYSYGWCADYPDPENFADTLFHSKAEQNLGMYSNAQLDRILEQARVERNLQTRIDLYQQAERLLIDDSAAIFLGHSRRFVLVNPRIEGYALTPLAVPLERYLRIRSSSDGQ